MSPADVIVALVACVSIGVGAFALGVRWARRGPAQPSEPSVPASEVRGREFPGEMLENLIRSFRSCVMIVDSDDRVVRSSPAATVMGVLRADDLVHEQLRRIVRQTRRDGVTHEAELRLTRDRFEDAGLAVAVRAASLGEGYVALFVEDRTRAQLVEDVRRDFVANVSHELKTPVGGISLLAEAVLDASDDPETVGRFARRILIESNRLTCLVQDIVDLSRLQAEERLTDPVPVVIADVVREAVAGVQTLSESRDATIACALDEEAMVMGDHRMLVMAVGNLLSNAIHYSPEQTRVSVTVRRRAAVVEIAVADQGQGMASEDLERIFERFYRVDRARSRATGGTGLGLAIVKHTCSNHGGEVKVWSALGEGSTFTMRLPAHQSDPSVPDMPNGR